MNDILKKLKDLVSRLFEKDSQSISNNSTIKNKNNNGSINNSIVGNGNKISNTINNGQKMSVDEDSETLIVDDFDVE